MGTAPFDIFPTYEEWADQFDFNKNPDMGGLAKAHFGHLPVWIDGNAYFGGASVYAKENNKLVDKKSKVSVTISEKKGQWFVKSNVFDLLSDFTCDIQTTESLGKAFEPEQYFENPDGTQITFDSDYFGSHRDPSAIPGPFAEAIGKKEIRVF